MQDVGDTRPKREFDGHEARAEDSHAQKISRIATETLKDGSTVEAQTNEGPDFLQSQEDLQDFPEEQ